MSSEIGSIQPNPYLFNIENRKRRKPHLAHEIGAGARCLKCADKCQGFQLHFWRKVCQNCRCGKDDHDIEDDEEDIGKIVIGKLFERPIRTKEEEQLYSFGTDLEMTNDSTGQQEKLKFDWLPPGVERAVAKRYMEMLPVNKRPIAGSEAAKERKRQLEQQIPLYDMDETERCETLPPEELRNFMKYLEVLRTRVAGQASVQEIVPLAPRHDPAVPLAPRHDPAVPVAPRHDPAVPLAPRYDPGAKPSLLPLKAGQMSGHVAPLPDNAPPLPTSKPPYAPTMQTSYTPDNLQSPPLLDNLPPPPDSWFDSSESGTAADPRFDLRSLENSLNNNVAGDARNPLARDEKNAKSAFIKDLLNQGSGNLGPGERKMTGEFGAINKNQQTANESAYPGLSSPLKQSNMVRSQYTPARSEFAVPGPIETELRPYMEGASPSKVSSTSASPSKSSVYQLTSPKPFLAKSEIQNIAPGQYSTDLTEARKAYHAEGEPQLPIKGDYYPGDRASTPEHKGSRMQQLTPKDTRITSSDAVQAPYIAQKDTLVGQKGQNAQGTNITILFPQESELLGKFEPLSTASEFSCQYCKASMRPGDVAVICERAGPGKYWHPKCFVCVTCKELLADLIYFYKDGKVFCGRHYTQAADIPRCKACDELIFGDSWTRADNCDWHIHHFCCFICDEPLAGSKYIPDEKDFPHCLSCYMSFKAKMCETCEDKISPQQTRAGYNGYFYHALPECFCCYSCRTSLIGKKFKMVKNWVFCSQDCINTCETDIAMNQNPKKKED